MEVSLLCYLTHPVVSPLWNVHGKHCDGVTRFICPSAAEPETRISLQVASSSNQKIIFPRLSIYFLFLCLRNVSAQNCRGTQRAERFAVAFSLVLSLPLGKWSWEAGWGKQFWVLWGPLSLQPTGDPLKAVWNVAHSCPTASQGDARKLVCPSTNAYHPWLRAALGTFMVWHISLHSERFSESLKPERCRMYIRKALGRSVQWKKGMRWLQVPWAGGRSISFPALNTGSDAHRAYSECLLNE